MGGLVSIVSYSCPSLMIIASRTQFHVEKAVVAAFNQEKALVGAFSVITNRRMELFEALMETKTDTRVSETPWWPGPAAQQLDISGLEFLLVFIEYATGPAASSSGP